MANLIYISFDGDHIGREIGRHSLSDDAEGIKRLSQAIDAGENLWKQWALGVGGQVISLGGDEGRIRVDASRLTEVPQIRRQYETAVGATCSVGVGLKLSEADKALMASKLLGGDRITFYEPSVEDILAEAKEKTEAEKIREAYLNKAQKVGSESLVGPEDPVGESDPDSEPQEPQAPEPVQDPEVLHDDFARLAQQHEADAQQQQQNDQAQVQADGDQQALKQQVIKVLKTFQAKSQELEQLQQQDPDLYQSMVGMVQGMLAMAQQLFGAGQSQDGQEVQKAEKLSLDEIRGINEKVKKRMQELADTTRGSAWRTKFGDLVVVGLDPHNRSQWRATTLAADGTPKYHYVAKDHVGALGLARSGGADLFGEPLKIMKKDEEVLEFEDLLKSSKVETEPHEVPPPKGVLHKDLMPGGKGDDRPDSRFDAEQLEAGMKTEMEEHGLDEARALEIAKDHLSEDPNYYKMEKAALTAGKTGRHLVRLPVGSQIDPSSSGHDTGGKVKVADQQTGKTKWRSVRAGLVMAPDGTPQSSRRGSE